MTLLTALELTWATVTARYNEKSCRAKGLFDMAVQWQQYADALEAHDECYPCELARPPRIDC